MRHLGPNLTFKGKGKNHLWLNVFLTWEVTLSSGPISGVIKVGFLLKGVKDVMEGLFGSSLRNIFAGKVNRSLNYYVVSKKSDSFNSLKFKPFRIIKGVVIKLGFKLQALNIVCLCLRICPNNS